MKAKAVYYWSNYLYSFIACCGYIIVYCLLGLVCSVVWVMGVEINKDYCWGYLEERQYIIGVIVCFYVFCFRDILLYVFFFQLGFFVGGYVCGVGKSFFDVCKKWGFSFWLR